MAATILNSPRTVETSIYVVRAFVQLRELLAFNKELTKRRPIGFTADLDEKSYHYRRGSAHPTTGKPRSSLLTGTS
jgi:hypothetical protein